MTDRFTKGDDLLKPGSSHKTFGITDARESEDTWTNRIEVYGSEELRDLVLRLLNQHGPGLEWHA